jgi:hypothetical protein
VPILSLLLVRSCSYFEASLLRGEGRSLLRTMLPLYGVLLFGQIILYKSRVIDEYWATFLQTHAAKPAWFYEISPIIAGAVGFLTLALVLLAGAQRKHSLPQKRFIFTLSLVGISALELGTIGRTVWTLPAQPSSQRSVINIDKCDSAALYTPRVFKYTTLSHDSVFSVGLVENWYFQRYAQLLRTGIPKEPDALACLLGIACGGNRFYFSAAIDHATVTGFLQDAVAHQSDAGCSYRVIRYDGDRLIAEVQCNKAGYFSFIDNWDEDWKAHVNGTPQRISPLFGTFKSVLLPPGRNRVVFSYQPVMGIPLKWFAPRQRQVTGK